MKPKALDLFCGGGGAALGMIAAGFDVTGVDIEPKHAKVYPGKFVCGDATNPPFDLADFDFVWASPPCQHASSGTPVWARGRYSDLIPATRALLVGHPLTVIENVPPAGIRADLKLNGPTVGLDKIERKRHFELPWFSLWPEMRRVKRDEPPYPIRRHPRYSSNTRRGWQEKGYVFKSWGVSRDQAAKAMGIDLPMIMSQIGEAVPPAYAEFIARNALEQMNR